MIKIFGCGDAFISHELPFGGYNGLEKIKGLINEHDFKFCNLETTIHNSEGYPSLFPGGGYAMASPQVLDSLKYYGFNAVSIANNHSMDYSHKGLERTLHYLSESGLKFSGAGMNLADASAPTYIECPEGRVAIIAATSSFHDSDAAGNQSINMQGRPGVNPLRHTEVYELEPELFENVVKIEQATGINAYRNMGIRMGYLSKNENIHLRDVNFQKGLENRLISNPLEKDVQRIVNSIHEARFQADCVVISVHSHQFSKSEERPDEFIRSFCHTCIDEGADIVFGHGSHFVRGIELYNGGVIFYGLADFILQNEQESKLPADFYEKYGLGYEYYGTVGKAMDARSNGRKKGLCANQRAWESIGVSLEFDNKIKNIKLYPVDLQFDLSYSRRGWPTINYKRTDIIEKVAEISHEYGTEIKIENGIGTVKIN